jgi:hypothetical protein
MSDLIEKVAKAIKEGGERAAIMAVADFVESFHTCEAYTKAHKESVTHIAGHLRALANSDESSSKEGGGE